MMPQITTAYTTWDQLQPADAIHKVGHVRMMVSWNQNGTLNVVESSGADWRVSYRTYATNQLTAYTPRYYNSIEGAPVPIPIPVIQFVVSNNDSVQLSWTCDQVEGIAGFHLYSSSDGLDWSLRVPITDLPDSATQIGIPSNPASPVFFRIRAVNANDTLRESISSDLYGTFGAENGQSPVLIVDGFDRFGGSGSWGSQYHPFAMKIGQILAELDVPFVTCANEALISSQIQIDNFQAVIWIVGDESTIDETLSRAEQTLLREYLSTGGQLFISGSEIGWDLDHSGDTIDQAFYHQYLKATYQVDDSNVYTVQAMSNSIFGNLSFQYDNGDHDVYPENYPDGVSATSGGQMALEYAGTSYAAAIQYAGLFGNGTIPGKLVYLAFPVETIYQHAQLVDFLNSVLTFFNYETVTPLAESDPVAPERFELEQNFPNPFNPVTTLRYSVPTAGRLTFTIYNLTGQTVYSQQRVVSAGGEYSESVDLSDDASGTYIARLIWNDGKSARQTATRKMVLLK